MAKYRHVFNWKTIIVFIVSFLLVSSLAWASAKCKKKNYWTEEFNISGCTFSDNGSNPYFSIDPGSEVILLEGYEKEELVQVRITVLNETEEVNGVTCRVILEEEWIDGELVEESWNWFARCKETGDIYYFGEEVNIYEDGEISHDGAWRAGDDAIPGIIMPGTFLIGSRYYQEIAPDVAMDRAEHIELGLTVTTPAQTFEDCIKILETSPLECNAKDIKIYSLGVGIIVDEEIERVSVFTPDPEE